MIPKIIHQIFYPFYYDQMPKKWADNVEIWKKIHPTFEHKVWGYDESLDFLKTEYPWFVDVWLGYKHNIQRCDAIRYFILYHFGGLYADLDLVPLQSIENLLVYPMLIPESSMGGGFSNSFLGCEPRHHFFKLATQLLSSTQTKYWFLGTHINVMYSTGPAFLDYVNKKYGKKNMFVICSKVYYGDCDACSDTSNTCRGVLFGHTDGKSWNKWDTKLLNHVYCNRKEYIILLLLIIIVLMWYFLYYKSCRMVCTH